MEAPMTQQQKQAAYDAWYIAEVDKGLADVEAGRTIPHDELFASLKAHMNKIAKQNAKKAA